MQFVIWVARHTFLTPLISQSALPEETFSPHTSGSGLAQSIYVGYFHPYVFFVSLSRTPFLRGDKGMSLAPRETPAFSILSQQAAVDMIPQAGAKETGRFKEKYGGHCCRTVRGNNGVLSVLAVDQRGDFRGIGILNLLKYWLLVTAPSRRSLSADLHRYQKI